MNDENQQPNLGYITNLNLALDNLFKNYTQSLDLIYKRSTDSLNRSLNIAVSNSFSSSISKIQIAINILSESINNSLAIPIKRITETVNYQLPLINSNIEFDSIKVRELNNITDSIDSFSTFIEENPSVIDNESCDTIKQIHNEVKNTKSIDYIGLISLIIALISLFVQFSDHISADKENKTKIELQNKMINTLDDIDKNLSKLNLDNISTTHLDK